LKGDVFSAVEAFPKINIYVEKKESRQLMAACWPGGEE
jgi:hypothetical protein